MKLPKIFFDESDYITTPELKRFISENIDKDFDEKEKLVEKIEEYANQSEENRDLTLKYFHDVLRFGKKEIKLFNYTVGDSRFEKSYQDIKNILNAMVKGKSNYIEANYSNEYNFINLSEENSPLGHMIILDITRKAYVLADFEGTSEYKLISTLFFVPERNLFLISTKNKSNMFDNNNLEMAESLTTSKIFNGIKNIVIETFNLIVEKSDLYEEKLFQMVVKYAKTPKEICRELDGKHSDIKKFTEEISENLNLSDEFNRELYGNLQNIYEKFITLNQKEDDIFKRENFYVIQLKSKDIEETTFTEHSSASDPIHSKAVFFNNKQALMSNKVCNESMFNGRRTESKYYGDWFRFKILANKESITIKFFAYTRKEDVLNAIKEFIQ